MVLMPSAAGYINKIHTIHNNKYAYIHILIWLCTYSYICTSIRVGPCMFRNGKFDYKTMTSHFVVVRALSVREWRYSYSPKFVSKFLYARWYGQSSVSFEFMFFFSFIIFIFFFYILVHTYYTSTTIHLWTLECFHEICKFSLFRDNCSKS